MTRAVSQEALQESNRYRSRHHGENQLVGAAAPERIHLVAKLDVRRSGPEGARYAYRWQSAWENPTAASYHEPLAFVLSSQFGILPRTVQSSGVSSHP